MKKSAPIWKLQPMSKPTEAHAADAIEIINGEAVRRVTLPQLDYAVYVAHEAGAGSEASELSLALKLPVDVITAALHRLAVTGLITQGSAPSIQ